MKCRWHSDSLPEKRWQPVRHGSSAVARAALLANTSTQLVLRSVTWVRRAFRLGTSSCGGRWARARARVRARVVVSQGEGEGRAKSEG